MSSTSVSVILADSMSIKEEAEKEWAPDMNSSKAPVLDRLGLMWGRKCQCQGEKSPWMLEKTARSMQMVGSTSSGRPSKKAQQVELKDVIKRLEGDGMEDLPGIEASPSKGAGGNKSGSGVAW